MLVEIAARYTGLALFTAAGSGLATLLASVDALPLPRRLAYGYLLGTAWIGSGLFALSHLFALSLHVGLVWAIAGVPILLGALRAFSRRHSHVRPRRVLPLAVKLFGGAAAVLTVALLADAIANPLHDWDGRTIWSTQARYIQAAGTVDAPVLRDPRWFISHPRYPLLLPLCQVAAMEVGGAGSALDERFFRPLYAAFFPALLLVLYDGSRRWVGVRAAAWAALVATLVPFFAFEPEGGAVGAYSDLPLACFWGGGLVLLLRARPRLSDGVAAGILLAAAVLTKAEGAPLALVALLLAAWQTANRRLWRTRLASWYPVASAVLLVALALALLLSWQNNIPNRNDEMYFKDLHPWNLAVNAVQEVWLLGPLVVGKMVSVERWSLFWWVAPVLFLAGASGLRRPPAGLLGVALVSSLAVGWAAYAKHAWDPAQLAAVTWDRMLLHAAVPLFLLLSMALRALAETLVSWSVAKKPREKGPTSSSHLPLQTSLPPPFSPSIPNSPSRTPTHPAANTERRTARVAESSS